MGGAHFEAASEGVVDELVSFVRAGQHTDHVVQISEVGRRRGAHAHTDPASRVGQREVAICAVVLAAVAVRVAVAVWHRRTLLHARTACVLHVAAC